MKPTAYIAIACCLFARVSMAEEPVAEWTFQPDAGSPHLVQHGDVEPEEPGPRPPEFPDFDANNTAVKLNGKGAYLSIADEGADSCYDFTNGDEITLEAWIKVDRAGNNQTPYIIGKGRTHRPGFASNNQNWALRVATGDGLGRLSFLFASAPGQGGSQWHRWDSTAAFGIATGWHHIAVAYRFGAPQTIRGWIDGVATDGTWSYGGATTKTPVVDDDEIWIGSSMGASSGTSFQGWLDGIAIHRRLLNDSEITGRFNRVGGPQVIVPETPTMPDIADVPAGRVLVTLSESLPSHERWPYAGESWPTETARWLGDAFILPRLPLRYDDWGIRTGWKSPMLVRMVADVDLPSGEHQILLRARALSRLWINGQLVAETSAITKDPPNGEEPIIPVAVPRTPGIRLPAYRQQEAVGQTKVPADQTGRSRVVLEMVVGGKKLRTEVGETCVAVQTHDGGHWNVLSATDEAELPLTDSAIEPVLADIESSLAAFDDHNRRIAAGSQEAFWDSRHAVARSWATEHPAPQIPVAQRAATHPIDAFIQQKIEHALQAAPASDSKVAEHFHDSVLPILRDNCFRCHDKTTKGGLSLSSRPALLTGGDSGTAAVVPGDPDAGEMMERIRTADGDLRMPPTGSALTTDEIATLEGWIRSGADWPAPPVSPSEVALAPLTSDTQFLRRAYLDTVGVPPSQQQAEAFLADSRTDKRDALITGLLRDERCADNQMGAWLDMLAENPTLLNKSQGSTGPFRFFLHDALRDNKSADQLVTELILMRGGAEEGGSAGFAMAAENDAPFAGKAHIIASAFQGVELQCARCHDAPFHDVTQQDLFSLAAMLQRKPASVPGTSRVPADFFNNMARQSLIQVTLKPGAAISPEWPFASVAGVADGSHIDELMQTPGDSRERLAALITSPDNLRFAQVMVNRIWQRLMGVGLVEPVHDWEGRSASHPELLNWLAHQLVAHNYDMRHVQQLIMTSDAYQRQAVGRNSVTSPERRYFNAPDPRRLTAEQVVDSLYAAVAAPMDIGELTFVYDGRRPLSNRQTLGSPDRAWMLASLNNERDRPSLSLPRAQAVTDVLEAFGWTGSRQKPISSRNTEPNLLQPGILANGVLTNTLSRASVNSELAELAIDAPTPEALVDALFLRILTRRPNPTERTAFTAALSPGFNQRIVPKDQVAEVEELPALPLVTWFNHLQSEANTIQQEVERRVRRGPPADPRLMSDWREVYEDVVWSLINHREFVWMP
jgi:hypothetical protein